MDNLRSTRDSVLKASRSYYAHRAYYEDLVVQRDPRASKVTKREIDFLEHAFRTHANRPVREVLDVACGGGRHVVGLAHRGYRCTGQDYTPERVEIARARAKREGVSLAVSRGEAAKLKYHNEFDAVIALNILFLLPSDEDVQKCLRQVHRALRRGGVLVCNIDNPFCRANGWLSELLREGSSVGESRVPGIRLASIQRLRSFDPIRGIGWVHETKVIETPEDSHVFRDRERVRLFTFWDLTHYLGEAGFRDIHCLPDWNPRPIKKPQAEELVFVSRK